MKFAIPTIAISVILAVAAPVSANAETKKEAIEGPHGVFHDSAAKSYKSDSARITNFRRREMRSISGHYRSLEAIIRYEAPFQAALSPHVSALQALAAQLPKNFPPGTAMQEGKWGAKTVIWEKPAEFKKHYESFRNSIANLKTSISAGNRLDMSKALKLVRHECLACHKEFRQRRKR